MAKKKKAKKKATRSKRAGAKVASAKKRTTKRRASKQPAGKKFKKKAIAKKAIGTKSIGAKKVSPVNKENRKKNQRRNVVPFSPIKPASRSGEQSGDFQGLSNVQGADSESVQELLEEGNAFEAEAVKGVEDAGERSGREVHTHEVPEDDVPEEYLDKE